MIKYNLEKFKADFYGISIKEMIDYILKKRTNIENIDIVNIGTESRKKRKLQPKPSKARHSLKYLVKIGFYKEITYNSGEYNEDFIPISQK